MKVVIFAGGYGTRFSEETHDRPKPMIEIGGMPIIWHIMKIYSHYGLNDFIICLGYKGYVIKEYFFNYSLHMSDVTFDMKNNEAVIHSNNCEPWKVSLIDTGRDTMTGGRLKRVAPYLGDEDFCLTYGDGVADINIDKLLEHHKKMNKLVTMTVIQPPGKFGNVQMLDNVVTAFEEKPHGSGSWINGGFFVVNPAALDAIAGDHISWEREPLETITRQGQLAAYMHDGYWRCMDTLRDKITLERTWNTGNAPWNVWNDV